MAECKLFGIRAAINPYVPLVFLSLSLYLALTLLPLCFNSIFLFRFPFGFSLSVLHNEEGSSFATRLFISRAL